MKAKRKAMSTRYRLSKSWTEVDSALALKAEEANAKRLQKDIILILRFPDPEISREIVKCYSPDIESVHFQLNFAPRYCLVHLKPGADVEKTIETLSKIPFGTGHLSVEIKQIPHKVHTTKLNEIDPYTLYVGNLPTTIACKTLKDHFPGASRIDIGFAQRMKYTRYAFIRYQTVQQAIEAYKRMLDAEIGGRNLTIRFRRLTAASDGNRDAEGENMEESHEDLSQSTVSEDHNQSSDDINKNNDKKLNNIPNEIRYDSGKNNETNSHKKSADGGASQSTDADNVNRTLLNIKPDPDLDPDDIVVRNEEIITRFDFNEDNIKQEKELSTDFEFFSPIDSQMTADSANRNKSSIQDIQSITDETNTTSTMSAGSLGEFLQTCQRPEVLSDDMDDIVGPPLKKKYRTSNNFLNCGAIKTENVEQMDTTVENYSSVLPNNAIKKEVEENNESISAENLNNTDSGENMRQRGNENATVYKNSDSSRRRKANVRSFTYQGSSSHNDDMVPSNALFLRDDMRNSLDFRNDVYFGDDNEFFETRAQSQRNIKVEPSCRRTDKRSREDINSHHSGLFEKSTVIDRSQFQSTVENDMVPEQNILSSRLTVRAECQPNLHGHNSNIKRETENDDIFSTPLTNLRNDATNNPSEDSDLSHLWSRNLLKQNLSSDSNNKIRKAEVSRSCTPIGSNEDDEIILVSDNISQEPKNSNAMMTSAEKSSTLSYNQADLLTFTRKNTAPISSLESSKIVSHHHDNLDKLFAQLDSDSDNEL